MAEPAIRKRKLTDYKPDPRNANRGSVRGQYMLDHSVEEVGAARSLVASADDYIPIGNHALQALVDAGITDVIEVPTDGRTVVVVKRTDFMSIDDPNVRKAAILDNRTTEVGLTWDAEQLLTEMSAGVDLSSMFAQDEIDRILMAIPGSDDWGAAFDSVPDGDKSPFQQMTFTLHDTQADLITQALAQARRDCDFDGQPNENSNGNALFMICKAYVNGVS